MGTSGMRGGELRIRTSCLRLCVTLLLLRRPREDLVSRSNAGAQFRSDESLLTPPNCLGCCFPSPNRPLRRIRLNRQYLPEQEPLRRSPRCRRSGVNFAIGWKQLLPPWTWWTRQERCDQCDQIGQFIGLWATFQSLWQKLVFPNLPHS